MRIAYLLLVHDQPRHLRRLLRALASPDSSFFIHLDRKSNMADFAHLRGEQVRFSAKRFPVHWGEFSQVEAILALLRQSCAAPQRPDYLILLSGSDYPLKDNKYIREFLEQHRGAEFMDVSRMPCEKTGKPLELLRRYRILAEERLREKAANYLAKSGFHLHLERDYRKWFGQLEPHAGSTWWALTRHACEYILEFASREKRLMNFFRHTTCPDEIVLHTILANSRFKERIERCLTYTDWSDGADRPAWMNEAHVERFEASERVVAHDAYGEGEFLFARKFSENSDALLGRIDALAGRRDVA